MMHILLQAILFHIFSVAIKKSLRKYPINVCMCVFYPRPVLAFGIVLPVCVCVYVCVLQSWVCPCDNLLPIQGRITKFGTDVQNTLFKISYFFWGSLTVTFEVKVNLQVKSFRILSLWVCSYDKSPPIESGFRNCDWKCFLALSRSLLIDFEIDWLLPSVYFIFISNLFFFLPNFGSIIHWH